MRLTIPELFFVVLIGVSDSGKSTFARKYFIAKGQLDALASLYAAR